MSQNKLLEEATSWYFQNLRKGSQKVEKEVENYLSKAFQNTTPEERALALLELDKLARKNKLLSPDQKLPKKYHNTIRQISQNTVKKVNKLIQKGGAIATLTPAAIAGIAAAIITTLGIGSYLLYRFITRNRTTGVVYGQLPPNPKYIPYEQQRAAEVQYMPMPPPPYQSAISPLSYEQLRAAALARQLPPTPTSYAPMPKDASKQYQTLPKLPVGLTYTELPKTIEQYY